MARQQKHEEKQRQKRDWAESFAADPIDLRGFPVRVVKKARSVIDALTQGVPYYQLNGRRLTDEHEKISIKIHFRYRLLCKDEGSRIVPYRLLSHETYNSRAKRKIA